ncbi:MAG: ATP-binding protein [Bifidobacterium sp.]|nr:MULTISPECIES: ATP-binding protein [Bifidobacterium]MDR4019613.1 ATP-binding protein [Bifidobacterium sp.]
MSIQSRALRPVGAGKTHLAVALGRLACMRAIPVGFFTATGLLMRLRRAKRGRLDAEPRQIARARLPVIDEFGYMPIDRTVHHGRLTGFEEGSYRSEHALMTR